MRPRFVISLLVLSNLILLGVVIWQARVTQKEKPKSSIELESKTTILPSNSRSIDRDTSALDEAVPERIVLVKSATGSNSSPTNWPRFDWRQVESDDYRTYVKNLRAIGCPEQTLRDIVAADLLQAFSAKRNEVVAAAHRDFKFWEFDEAKRAEFARARRALDDSMTGMLRDLVGADATSPSAATHWVSAELNQTLAFLPPEKRAVINSTLSDYAYADVELPHPISKDRLTVDQAEELQQRLEKFDRKQVALKNLLTPEEFELMELSVSSTANNLRHGMAKFHPTEKEFKTIFPVWRAHDERISRLWAAGEPDPGNDDVFAAIQKILGEKRFAEYRNTWWK